MLMNRGNAPVFLSPMKDLFPNIPPTVKGIALAFLATLGMANVYVFSKAALLEVNYYQFQFYWFGFALVWILPYLYATGIFKKIPSLSKDSFITLAIIGILELGAASLLFLSVQILLVRPSKGAVDHMQAYAKSPEDARQIITPSASVKELRDAEEALQMMQTQLTGALKLIWSPCSEGPIRATQLSAPAAPPASSQFWSKVRSPVA